MKRLSMGLIAFALLLCMSPSIDVNVNHNSDAQNTTTAIANTPDNSSDFSFSDFIGNFNIDVSMTPASAYAVPPVPVDCLTAILGGAAGIPAAWGCISFIMHSDWFSDGDHW